jgi:hypothetical protein
MVMGLMGISGTRLIDGFGSGGNYELVSSRDARFTPAMSALFKACFLAARPKTLPAAIVPVWTGCVLAWKLAGVFDLTLALCTLGGSVAIQIATNFFNDAIDAKKGADTARRLGPLRVTASGLLKSQTVMGLATGFLGLAFLCGVVLYQARGWPILAIGVPSLFFSYGYTGGPFPLAYRGLGELFVIGFFGLVAVTGTVFIQLGTWPPEGASHQSILPRLFPIRIFRAVEVDIFGREITGIHGIVRISLIQIDGDFKLRLGHDCGASSPSECSPWRPPRQAALPPMWMSTNSSRIRARE